MRAIVLDLTCPACGHPQAVLTFATPDDPEGAVVLAEGGKIDMTVECGDCSQSVKFNAAQVA